MQVKFEPTASGRRYTGIGAIAALHLALGYALVSGLAPQMVEAIKKPMEAVLIQEVKLPPPPPPPPPKIIQPANVPTQAPQVEAPPPPFVPPPEVSRPPAAAPAIESSATPPRQLPVIAPPAPPAPPAPAKSDIALACPTQVAPQVPEKAVRDGLSGTVRAQATIRGGVVSEVAILSGPRVFHAAVRAAMEQYRCSAADGTVAVQDFSFKVE